MNTQFESMIKDKKKVEMDVGKKDARINKLSEDLDKMKMNARGEKMVPKVSGGGGDGDKGSQMLINENKKLEKQRNELLVGFKKQ